MNKADWIAILKGAGLAAGGALLTYLVDAAAGGVLGPWGLALAPLLSVLMNVIRKSLSPTDPPKPPPSPPGVVDPPTPFPAANTTPLKLASVVLALVCLAATARAELKISGPTTVPSGRLVRLKAEGVAAKAGVRWRIYPPTNVDRACCPRGRLEFVAPDGVYQVELETGLAGADGSITFEDAQWTVTIGQPGPTPPGPGPGPGPNPPNPPNPPAPEDPLTKDLRATIATDIGDMTIKTKQVNDLATLYDMAQATADDAKIATAGDLLTVLRQASAAVLSPDALKGTRTRISKELTTVLPTDPTAQLTPALRAAAKALFARIATALKGAVK